MRERGETKGETERVREGGRGEEGRRLVAVAAAAVAPSPRRRYIPFLRFDQVCIDRYRVTAASRTHVITFRSTDRKRYRWPGKKSRSHEIG